MKVGDRVVCYYYNNKTKPGVVGSIVEICDWGKVRIDLDIPDGDEDNKWDKEYIELATKLDEVLN